tara:strand:+ start:563 stop:1729 length:1167 start_codon:yes stop_codon:yes gene_type:complete
MGIFKKIFKKIGKVFKGIGKTIKKGFQKFGKFMNKLGILGQIGMMFIMPGIANFAMKGLMQLGSGFMQGLANVAANSGGLIGGMAKVSHAVLSTVAKVAQTGMNAFRTITDTVMGVVTDTATAIGQKMGMNVAVPKISSVTGLPMKVAEGVAEKTAGSILENAAARFQAGTAKTWASLTDTAKVVGDIMPGGAKYTPQYENIGEVDMFGKFKKSEVNYSTKNMDAFTTEANRRTTDMLTTGSPEQQKMLGLQANVTVADGATEPSAGFFSKRSLKDAAEAAITQKGYQFLNAKGEVVDYSRTFDPTGATISNDYLAESIGSGAPLYGTGSLSSTITNYFESTDFLNNALNTESYLDNMPFTQNMYEEYMQKSSINGGRGQFAGSFVNE